MIAASRCHPGYLGPACDIRKHLLLSACVIVNGLIQVNALLGRVTTSCSPPSVAARADVSPNGMGRVPYANVLKTSTAMTAQKVTRRFPPGVNSQCASAGNCPNSTRGYMCDNRGTCNSVTGFCVCDTDYYGPDCTMKKCPLVQGRVCNGQGASAISHPLEVLTHARCQGYALRRPLMV